MILLHRTWINIPSIYKCLYWKDSCCLSDITSTANLKTDPEYKYSTARLLVLEFQSLSLCKVQYEGILCRLLKFLKIFKIVSIIYSFFVDNISLLCNSIVRFEGPVLVQNSYLKNKGSFFPFHIKKIYIIWNFYQWGGKKYCRCY